MSLFAHSATVMCTWNFGNIMHGCRIGAAHTSATLFYTVVSSMSLKCSCASLRCFSFPLLKKNPLACCSNNDNTVPSFIYTHSVCVGFTILVLHVLETEWQKTLQSSER